ncbi:hypothetical protein [Streptomyces sp. NPDC056544]|uniref:hypothetical protein n=1 Tax=unclassified Streptomyces TaxID=2593676 RepID=UPI0036BC16B3
MEPPLAVRARAGAPRPRSPAWTHRLRAELIHWLADICDGRGPGSTERGDADAAVFDLVLAELPVLLRLLEDPAPETRRAVICLTPLASLVGEDAGEDVGDRLARRYEEDPDGMVRADVLSALAALARLGGPSEPALALLAQGPVGWLALARDLGPAGRPLLPRIEAALEEPAPATRLWAAEVHRRITRDPYARCVPVLTDLVRTRPCDEAHRAAPLPAALAALAELGVTPDEIRPHLRTWADSERRIIPCYGRHGPLDDDVLREAARAHLSLLGDR